MSRWFRFYDAVLDDPKAQRLSDTAFRAWVNLMCVASRNNGFISADLEDISFSLRVSVGKARDLLQILQSAELIDRFEDGWEPHNWKTRQYESDSAAERMRRHRALKKENKLRNALRDSDAVEADTEQNRTEADAEKKEGCGVPSATPSPEFIRIPTNRFVTSGEEYHVTEQQVVEFKALYPAVDIEAQLRAMRGWAISNDEKRKTRKGMARFVNGWLSGEQNKSRAGPGKPSAPSGDYMRSGQVISLVKQ